MRRFCFCRLAERQPANFTSRASITPTPVTNNLHTHSRSQHSKPKVGRALPKMDDLAESFEETVNVRQDKGKGRAAGRGGGRGHGRGGGGGASREMLLSKALSKLLRHQAESAGIQLDREGYAPLDKVVSCLLLPFKARVYEMSFEKIYGNLE